MRAGRSKSGLRRVALRVTKRRTCSVIDIELTLGGLVALTIMPARIVHIEI